MGWNKIQVQHTKFVSLSSAGHFRSRADSTARQPSAFRHLNTSRSSATSCENGPAMPRLLSRLVALSDVPWRNAASHTEPLNQSVSYASIVCPRSSSVHSNSCQVFVYSEFPLSEGIPVLECRGWCFWQILVGIKNLRCMMVPEIALA